MNSRIIFVLFSFSSLVVLTSHSAFGAPTAHPGSQCFEMAPATNFDDRSCVPVQVRIQFKNCQTGAFEGSAVTAFARFECKSRPPKLKYWYQNSMLLADLEKDGDSYKITKTYSLEYGPSSKNGKHEARISGARASDGTNLEGGVAAAPNGGVAHAGIALTPLPGHGASKTAPVINKISDVTDSEPEAKKPFEVMYTNDVEVVPSAKSASKAQPVPSATPPSVSASPVPAGAVTAPGAAPATEPAAPASTPVASGHDDSCSLCKFNLQLSGMADAYYAFNFNNPPPLSTSNNFGSAPADQNKYVEPNNYHDAIMLNFAEVSLTSKPAPAGFRLDLGFGPYADQIAGNANNSGSYSDISTRNLLQAYVTYEFPFGVDVELGKMYTHMGYESVEPELNFNYSRSYMFRYVLPTWHTGVKVRVHATDTLTVAACLYNGSNTYYENNSSKSYGGHVKWKPSENFTLAANYLGGIEVSPGGSSNRNTFEGYAEGAVVHWLTLAVEGATAQETLNDGSWQQIASGVIFADVKPWTKWHIYPRYEVVNDTGTSFGTGLSQIINSGTLGVEFRPVENFRLQAEYRYDSSDEPSFVNTTGPQSIQQLATLAVMLTF